jgi:6-phosphogluconolactonase
VVTVDPKVEVLADQQALAARAASVIADAITEAASKRNRCVVALSRLSHPAIWHELASYGIDGALVDLFQVDERVAPRGTDERNLTGVERDLLDYIAGAKPCVHAMPVGDDSLVDAAATYARELENAAGSPPVIDVVHLGLGPDGHTASLAPSDPVLDVTDRPVAVTRAYQGYRRITLTYPVLDRARFVVFVVSGEDKRDALRAVLDNDQTKPAARLRSENVLLLADVVL